ncbi:MAG: outer membrane beta-barrel protein [Chitinophagaceae bacterium]
MKKIILALAGVLMTGSLFAQTQTPGSPMTPNVQFGIKAGPNFSSITTKTGGSNSTSSLITSLQAGVVADLMLADQFYLEPGLLFAGKGGSINGVKGSISYLEVPLDFMFKPQLGTGMFFIGLGPYFADAIGGNNVVFGPNTGNLKRFDAGANFQAGYQLPSGLNFSLTTDLGLINIMTNGDNNNGYHNTSFGLNVGYLFGSK